MADGYGKRQTKRTNELIYLAWNAAALSRVKEMPKLEDLYVKDKIARPQTDDEMFAMVQMLNAAYGGEVVYI